MSAGLGGFGTFALSLAGSIDAPQSPLLWAAIGGVTALGGLSGYLGARFTEKSRLVAGAGAAGLGALVAGAVLIAVVVGALMLLVDDAFGYLGMCLGIVYLYVATLVGAGCAIMVAPWIAGLPLGALADTPAHDRNDGLALVLAPVLAMLGAVATALSGSHPTVGGASAIAAIAGLLVVARAVSRVRRRTHAVHALVAGSLEGWRVIERTSAAEHDGLLPLMRAASEAPMDGVLVRVLAPTDAYRDAPTEQPVALVHRGGTELASLATRRWRLSLGMAALHVASLATTIVLLAADRRHRGSPQRRIPRTGDPLVFLSPAFDDGVNLDAGTRDDPGGSR